VGSSSARASAARLAEEQHKKALEKGFDRFSPFFILQMIINMAPGLVTIRYGASRTGLRWPALLHLCPRHRRSGEVIRIGETDAMIAGGRSGDHPAGHRRIRGDEGTSTRNDDPARASRPFDKDRDGFVEGEGAGILRWRS
jgi:3-oxoacyl-[acyl-carrier-protein] synthase II